MKPSFQHLGFDTVAGSFLCYWVRSAKFGFHWHYHPEVEISYVVRGRGTRLVGDHTEPFVEGDLLFLGSDLPHTLISDETYHQDGREMEVVVIQFPQEIIAQRSMEIVELGSIGQMLKAGDRGLHFSPETAQSMDGALRQLPELSGFAQYHALLGLLHQLAEAPARPLASATYAPHRSRSSEGRIGEVCTYIHDHYTEAVTIAHLADLAHMSEAAFCRFFKKMTGKTALQYINDLRIGKACQLLLAEGMPVSEVAFQSGYPSLTHFNRSFKARKGVAPTEYRKRG
ncbi:MAG TPA: hypothetical protein DCP28_00435, partial [Cytophagales bacterium]|nr:hypothetical protein [Cytophagales bacterium]